MALSSSSSFLMGGVDLESAAAWTGVAISAVAFLWHGIMHIPMRTSSGGGGSSLSSSSSSRLQPLVESWYAYFALLLAALAQLIRFLTEARHHGWYTGRPDGITSWVRPVGVTVAWYFFLGAFSMLSKSGAVHFLGVTLLWLATGLAVLVTALVPEHDFDNGSFLLLACVCALLVSVFLWALDHAEQRQPTFAKLIIVFGMVTYLVLSGVDLVNPHLASDSLMACLFTGTAALELLFFMAAYYDVVEMHVIKSLVFEPQLVPVIV